MLLNTHTHTHTRCLISNDKLLWIEPIKLSRKVLYHFSIVNKISITKNHRILILNNFLFKYYPLQKTVQKIARDKNYLFLFRKTLRIFLEFFINFLVLHFLIGNYFCQHEKILKTL